MISTAALMILLAAADSVASAVPDTAAARQFLGAPSETARAEIARGPTRGFLPTLAVHDACAKLRSKDLLRIEGEFGTFTGSATTISLEGFSGLRSRISESSFSALSSEPSARNVPAIDHLDWAQIRIVEVRRNRAATYALRGALFTGAVAIAVAGYGYYHDGPDVDGPSLQGFAALFALPAMAVSAVLGGAIGAAASSWEPIYLAR